jgi:hypothetical protein
MRCGGDHCVRVELQIGAMHYTTIEDAERLVATGNYEELEPESNVRVLRELPPAGWERPPTDTRPAMLFEDGFRKRLIADTAESPVSAEYDDGVCTCGAGEDWCDYCREHCVECGLARSMHPICHMDGKVVDHIHEFVSVQGELFEETG